MGLLEEWTNDILYEDNIRITSLKSDFNDGVVFKKIVEKLQGCEIKLPLSEGVQAKERQMKNLSAILDEISNILGKSAISDDSEIPVYVRFFKLGILNHRKINFLLSNSGGTWRVYMSKIYCPIFKSCSL